MIEEINEDNINKLLKSLPEDLNTVERIIMVNEGTVQTLLSVFCRTPVKVVVISQHELADVIIRWSKLVAEYSEERSVTICLAESIIPASNPPEFINMINDRQKGIGQIIKEIGLETSRHIKGFHIDDSTVARTYMIEGDCSMVITEVFNRDTILTMTDIPLNIRAVKRYGAAKDGRYDMIKPAWGDSLQLDMSQSQESGEMIEACLDTMEESRSEHKDSKDGIE